MDEAAFHSPDHPVVAREPDDLARASVLMEVPTFYTRLLDAPGFTRETAAHMRLFVSDQAPN